MHRPADPSGLRLPKTRDLAWALGLVLAGGLLGLALNAVTGRGINLRIALESPFAPDASPAPLPAVRP